MPERRSKTSMVPVVWTTFGISSAQSKWFPVAIGDHGQNLVISLWPGDKAKINGVAAKWLTPSQKIQSAKIHWKSSCLNFLGSKQHPPHWLSSKGSNYQCGVLFISAGAIKGHFEGKMPQEGHQVGLVLAWQCPGSLGTCNPEETGLPRLPMSWSPTLFSRSGPIGLPTVHWTEKTIERSPFFIRRRGHCHRGYLVGRKNFWIFFLSGLQSEQQAKKCIELRGEYVE